MITEKILVVDDEETVCKSIKKILSRRGYSVDGALSAEDALEKIQHSPFDLVITDLMMPKTNGLELLQIIRDHYPELEVVLITGYSSIESAVKATKLGAASYLPKPFTPEELSNATERALKNKRAKVDEERVSPKKAEPASDVIDVDMPFSEAEVVKRTSKEYVESLTHSDVPLAKRGTTRLYCHTGKRDCRRIAVEGRECPGECPIERKEKARVRSGVRVVRSTGELIDVDLPFRMSDVEQYTGLDYINCMSRSDIPRVALYGRDATAKHSVLVVDDEPIVCHSVRKILSKKSCSVEEAFDVDAALQKMKLRQYDLVILDLKMPKRNGMEVLQSIRVQDPDVPVVMVTGFASIETAIEAIKAGAYNFIPKPFTPDELSRVAEEALAS